MRERLIKEIQSSAFLPASDKDCGDHIGRSMITFHARYLVPFICMKVCQYKEQNPDAVLTHAHGKFYDSASGTPVLVFSLLDIMAEYETHFKDKYEAEQLQADAIEAELKARDAALEAAK